MTDITKKKKDEFDSCIFELQKELAKQRSLNKEIMFKKNKELKQQQNTIKKLICKVESLSQQTADSDNSEDLDGFIKYKQKNASRKKEQQDIYLLNQRLQNQNTFYKDTIKILSAILILFLITSKFKGRRR